MRRRVRAELTAFWKKNMNTEEMLKILVCPKCGGALTALPGAEKPEGFFCGHCGVVYPIREEIPVMLIEEAIDRASWDAGTRVKENRS